MVMNEREALEEYLKNIGFAAFVKTRARMGGEPGKRTISDRATFIRDVRRDHLFPKRIHQWEQVENHLRRSNAGRGALEQARLLWREFEHYKVAIETALGALRRVHGDGDRAEAH